MYVFQFMHMEVEVQSEHQRDAVSAGCLSQGCTVRVEICQHEVVWL